MKSHGDGHGFGSAWDEEMEDGGTQEARVVVQFGTMYLVNYRTQMLVVSHLSFVLEALRVAGVIPAEEEA